MGREGLIRDSLVAVLLLFVIALLVPSNASANPIVPGPDFSSASEAISWLFWSNLWIDLFWFTTSVYFVLRVLGPGAGKISRSPLTFLASVLAASLVIAVAGTFIDFYAFYGGSEQIGYTFWPNRADPFFGSTEFFAALLGIFASIFVSSVLLARLRLKPSLIPALAMTALNPIAWVVVTDSNTFVLITLALSALVLSLLSLALLMLWHERTFSKATLTSGQASQEPGV